MTLPLRPASFEDYVGQSETKERLKVLAFGLRAKVAAAFSPQDKAKIQSRHLLIEGPPGYGKTILAGIYAGLLSSFAKADNWPVYDAKGFPPPVEEWEGPGQPKTLYRYAALEGRDLISPDFLDDYLLYLQPQGVIFIDEIQAAPKRTLLGDSPLLTVLETGMWHSSRRQMMLHRDGFTMIAATTDPGKIPAPLRERFELIRLRDYSPEELGELASRLAARMGIFLSSGAVGVLVDRSRGCPRDVVQAVQWIDLSLAAEGKSGEVSPSFAEKAMEMRGIRRLGLTDDDISVLRALSGGPMGVGGLIAMTQYGSKENFATVEDFLLRKGFIGRSSRGRVITEEGKRVLVGL